MFVRIGLFAARHAKAILIGTLIVLLGAGAFGFTAFSKLKSQGFDDPASESTQVAREIEAKFGGGDGLVFLIRGPVDDPAVRRAGTDLTGQLGADPELR